ncbi:DNA repair and recombination protein RAD54B [Caerostris extrusa]|uniref:DNA repair and recombination protein RAD54-like n=1 Tax=Caerostris extrusa TaxID=172846 RepID=A0AAV4MDF4_CAEEX|nr:DNA repair and recombination protein RAD54B [Caerostris extrusa]
MRRSAAPSFQSAAKRLRFLSPTVNSETQIDNENELFNLWNPKAANATNITVTETNITEHEEESLTISKEKENNAHLSRDEVLELLLKPISQEPVFDDAAKDSIIKTPLETAASHKIWEGDGILIVKNRSAVLKDSNGKVIDRGIGYKLKEIESLEDGSKFYIGGKECEIQCLISAEEYKNQEVSETPENDSTLQVNISKPSNLSRKIPQASLQHSFPKFITPFHKKISASENQIDVDPESVLLLPLPTEEHQKIHNKENLQITPVKVDTFLTKQLRIHQKEGIIFLYKCILGFQHEYGEGAILADEMGLGKTLQCIALIWTLYKQGPYGRKPILKKTIIITPIDKKHTIKDYLKFPKAVLIISYEMFLRSAEILSPVSFDLVICDEGHRIKNLNIKISNVINCLSTNKRILLTGTPIQNDLAEFFSIVDFVNPGALGSLQSFRRSFEKPILMSRNQECTEEEKESGEQCSEELNRMASLFMLRRTQEVINQYLPSKTEVVAFCRPTELQIKLYNHLLNTGALWKLLTTSGFADSSLHLIYISLLRKLCNHPSLLYNVKNLDDHHILNCIESVFPADYQPSPSDSGKMKVLENMLASFFSNSKKEKIVIVSGFTKTLNIIEDLCKSKSYLYLRLDGSTTTSSRQDLVDTFNRSYTKYHIFLLSSKAGGVGFNLIGASRILLYDIDWNPANDLQAMARIWRDGQKHSVYIYRLF